MDSPPRLEDDDNVWQRWIEQGGDELKIVLQDGPHMLSGGIRDHKWLQRLITVLSEQTGSSKTRIRKLVFHDFAHESPPEDDVVSNVALCALMTLLREHLERFTFSSYAKRLFLGLTCVPTMPKLRTLDLRDSDCEGQGDVIADLIRKSPNLTSLDLRGLHFDDDDLVAIASAPFSSLERLDTRCEDTSSSELKSIARLLKNCYQIREVFISYYRWENDSCMTEVFASLADKTRLEVLHNIDDWPLLIGDAAQHLQKMVNLRDLRIPFDGSDSDFELLCSCLRGLRRLSKLVLDFINGFSAECERQLVDLLRCMDQLTTLHFSELGRSDVVFSFKHLGRHIASSNCRLRKLRVGSVDDTVVSLVAALKCNTSLRSFSCWSSASDDKVANVLGEALRHNRTLRKFSGIHDLSPESWTVVLEGARCSAIEHLHINPKGEMTDQMHRLLEDVANQGYLVNMGGGQVSESCKQRMELNKRMHDAARNATLVMLAVRRFRRSALNFLQYDIVKLIAKFLCATRANDAWSNACGEQKEPEQKKQKM